MYRRNHERHRLDGLPWLRAGVLGANDGIVSTSSSILGVAAVWSALAMGVTAGVGALVGAATNG